ncbi:G-box-binding factor-like isoform X2 [Uranotaenia lowii]|uniref:G-box-binding factor-like isoform X2 n=1 Tax=Uranotaenia lowii TaxID=190385 RepID=UPI002479FF96|nr:G-box-binding factor-like isoform X2 [Uranotaenia lowii]
MSNSNFSESETKVEENSLTTPLPPRGHVRIVDCLINMSSTRYVATVNALNMFDKLESSSLSPGKFQMVSVPPPTASNVSNFTVGTLNVTSSTVAIARPSLSPPPSTIVGNGTEEFVVLPGPEDVLLFNSTNGLYQQSVTLTARMYPIEATAAKSFWGLPTLIWAILIGTIVILIVILATLFFCCWLQPRTRKLLASSYYTGSTVSHNSIVPKSQTSDSNQLVMPLSIGICPPQYSAPPPPNNNSGNNTSGSNNNSNSVNNSPCNQHSNQQSCSGTTGVPCHPGSVGSSANSAGQHGKYSSSPQQQQQQQYSHQYHQQMQQQYQHHHQCIHHQQQQQQHQQSQQYHYAQMQQHQHPQQQCSQYGRQSPHQQSLQQYYNQQQQQQHQHQQITQYIHPSQQQALQQQQQREHQIQQHHYHHQQQQQQQQHNQQQQQQQTKLVHHKSMWAINPLYASSGVIHDSGSSRGRGSGGFEDDDDDDSGNTSYRTRSLPSWGKNKQRPLSNADDLDELYAKVNFSKKRRNRMRNDEAAIIALSRSRSQNLAAHPLADQDAVVIYDERTAL